MPANVATTGVAGPDPQDGQPVGTVFVAVDTADAVLVRRLQLPGDRAAVRAGTVAGVLELVAELLGGGGNGAVEEAGPAGR